MNFDVALFLSLYYSGIHVYPYNEFKIYVQFFSFWVYVKIHFLKKFEIFGLVFEKIQSVRRLPFKRCKFVQYFPLAHFATDEGF